MPTPNQTAAKARNAKVIAGINKDLATMATILLAGGSYTPSSLAAVFEADSKSIDDADDAKKAAAQKVLDAKATHAKTAIVLAALRSFLLATFGTQAVAVLGDFGMNAPKPRGSKTVTTKAVAVAKAKATRAARGTKGPVAKLATVGSVDATAIKEAINSPTPVTPAATATTATTTTSATTAATPPAPAAGPAPLPPAPATTPKS